MKVAISSTGREIDSNIYPKFERCPFFMIVNTKTKEEKVIVNKMRESSNEVGTTIANIALNEKIEAAITTDIGPSSFEIFERCEIKVYRAKGKIKDAIKQFKKGKLPGITKATVPKYTGLKQREMRRKRDKR